MVRIPGRPRQRALVAALALLLPATLLGGAAPSLADDHHDLTTKQSKVKKGIKAASADLEESSQAAYRATQKLQQAQSQLGTAQAKLATTRQQEAAARALDAKLQAALVVARQKEQQAQAALEAGKAKVKEQRATVGRMAAQSMQKADPRLVGIVALMQADDPADLSTEVQTVGNVIDREDRELDALREAEAALAVQERKVEQAKEEVARQRAAAAANLAKRTQLARQAAAETASVQQLVSVRRDAEHDAEEAKNADKAQLAALKKENDRITAMLRALASKSGSYDNGGTLLRPVTGYVTSPFGYRVHPIYGYYSLHDGTDFHAPCGTPLRAAGNGKVVSEYYQSAWGNRLILDLGRVDGHGISVIYNHLSAYKAHTGDVVSRGDTVGYAGTTGWSTGCHLHFTVMVDGVPKNPLNYF